MRPGAIKQRDVAPVQTFAKAAAKCSAEARIYGACVTANYENIERNMCQKEFQAFKACVQQTDELEETPDFFRYGLSVCAMQLKTGLIPRPTFEGALHKIAAKHALSAQIVKTAGLGTDTDDSSEDGYDGDVRRDGDYSDDGSPPSSSDPGDPPSRRRRRRQRRRGSTSNRGNKRRRAPVSAEEDPSPNHPSSAASTDDAPIDMVAPMDATNQRLLCLLGDPTCEAELRRFLSIDEATHALAFKTTELLDVLCAAFPYTPSQQTGHIRSNTSPTPRPTRPIQQKLTDAQVFDIGSLWNSWLPNDYCRRLAWGDYPASAKAMALEARLSSPLPSPSPVRLEPTGLKPQHAASAPSSRSSSGSYGSTLCNSSLGGPRETDGSSPPPTAPSDVSQAVTPSLGPRTQSTVHLS